MTPPISVVIPARNEAATIATVVVAACRALRPVDRLWVFDDGSTDGTAEAAQRAGAMVLRRPAHRSGGGKGGALAWGLAQLPLQDDALVLVIDADSQLDAHCLDGVRARFEAGAEAVQTRIEPVVTGTSAATMMAACSTLAEQLLDDRLRSTLGWPVRLRGTGMGFRRSTLAALLSQVRTEVEDVELSLLCLARGIHVTFAPEARLRDPLPVADSHAARQRARWLKGQAGVWRAHWPLILSVLWRGPAAWSLLGSVLFKPRLATVALRSLLLTLTLAWPGATWLALCLLASLAADMAYMLVGVAALHHRTGHLLAVQAPLAYASLWARSAWLAATARPGWLRARPE